jgi:cytochrome c peroxidase
MDVFFGKANCTVCHAGPTFTDERFHNTGVSNDDAPSRASVTGRRNDEGRFKVPSLRNVALTGPYMHDGSLATLEAVVEFYNRGGGPNPRLDPDIHPLGLSTEDKRALVEFLRSLTSRD